MKTPLDIQGNILPKDERIRAGFIGCGSHAFRNVYPALQFANVNLVATCDLNKEKAAAYAQQFGAENSYTDFHEMIERENLDAVFIVTNYDTDGTPKYLRLAQECMKAGVHVWTEKPPTASVKEVEDTIKVSKETGKFTMVGFKKCFFPANEKAKEISERDEFGKISTIYVRYPQYIPREDEKPSCENKSIQGFLDHLVHPMSLMNYFGGKVASVFFDRADNGGGFAMLNFQSGAKGIIHFCHGMAETSPFERLEIIGQGANVIVDNSVKLTYYRKGRRGEGDYGGATNFIGKDEGAPMYWEPEFSLGQLYNKGLFLLGYYGEVQYFADCVKNNTAPIKCGLQDTLEITKIFEAFMKPAGELIKVND